MQLPVSTVAALYMDHADQNDVKTVIYRQHVSAQSLLQVHVSEVTHCRYNSKKVNLHT